MSYNENRMGWSLVISGFIILMAFCIVPGSASPQLPCEFYGTVTNGGTPTTVGTEITAYVNGVKQGSISVKETGKYGGTGTFDPRLIVLSGENDFSGGAPMITFKIGDTVADQSAQYTPGTSSEMALTTGGTPVVVPVPAGQSSQPSSSPVTSMQGQSVSSTAAVPSLVQTPAPVVTTAPVSMMQATSTVVPVGTTIPVVVTPIKTAVPVVTVIPVVTSVPTSVSPSLMSVSTQVNGSSTTSPVLTTVTAVPIDAIPVQTSDSKATVIPVVTVVPATSNSSAILSVSTPAKSSSTTSLIIPVVTSKPANSTPVQTSASNVTAIPVVTAVPSSSNLTSILSVTTPVNGSSATPVVQKTGNLSASMTYPVVPVKTATSAVVIPSNQTVNTSLVSAGNQSNVTNSPSIISNLTKTATVSFPSGQVLNQ